MSLIIYFSLMGIRSLILKKTRHNIPDKNFNVYKRVFDTEKILNFGAKGRFGTFVSILVDLLILALYRDHDRLRY